MISHFVNRRAGFTCVMISGCPQLTDYRAAAEVILSNSFFDPGAAWLCDLTHADFTNPRTCSS